MKSFEKLPFLIDALYNLSINGFVGSHVIQTCLLQWHKRKVNSEYISLAVGVIEHISINSWMLDLAEL